MSGRSVATIIASLKETEQITFRQLNNLNRDIENGISCVERRKKEIDSIIKNIQNQSLLYDSYNSRFSQKMNSMERELTQQKQIQFQNVGSIQQFQNQNKEIDANMKILLQEANNIQRELSGSNSYSIYQLQDKATSINQRIRRQLQEKNTLINEIANRQRLLEQEKGKANRVLKDCQALHAQSKELSKQGQIAENAENYKKEITSLHSDIDSVLAEKFFAKEFKQFSSACAKFLQLTDKQVIDTFKQALENVMAFQEKLTTRYNQHLEQLETRQNLLDQLQNDFDSTNISHPSKKDQEVSLPKYQKLYLENGTAMVEHFVSLITQCQQQITAEDFHAFDSTYPKAIEQFEQMQKDCRIKDEEMQKNFKLAKNIFDVFKKMNCDIDTEYIAGDGNPKDGIKIIGKYMNELIEVTTANANQDANIDVEINHILENGKDAVNCEKFLNPFAQELRNAGIPLIDIHKDEQSVLAQKKGTGKKVEQQHKKTQN